MTSRIGGILVGSKERRRWETIEQSIRRARGGDQEKTHGSDGHPLGEVEEIPTGCF